MLATFLGTYLGRLTPDKWTKVLASLDVEQVPVQGREPWTFITTSKYIYEPTPTVEATCVAILAVSTASPEYSPLAARLCTLLSKYTRVPRVLVEAALKTITSSQLIETSPELLFFVVVAARLANLELQMRPAITSLVASHIPPPFQSMVERFKREPINREELRVMFSALGAICSRTDVGFMEGELCLLAEFDSRKLHVVKHKFFKRARTNMGGGGVENVVQTVDSNRKVVFFTTVDGMVRLVTNSKSRAKTSGPE